MCSSKGRLINVKTEESIYDLKDYGKSVIKLKEVLEERNMTRNKLCTLVGTSYDLINQYYNNTIGRVDLDTISKFCYVLKCDINDLLEYIPSDK